MSIMKTIHQEMVTAMKTKDKAAKDVYSNILAAMKAKAKDIRAEELDDTCATEVILKLSKQNQESIDTCPKERKDILDKLTFERSIITQYMPKQMSEQDIEKVVIATLGELDIKNPTVKDKGAIMKVLMPKVKGKADGKLVNSVVEKMLK